MVVWWNNSVCDESSSCSYIINILHPRELSLIHQAGNPAREVLLQYTHVDFLKHYFMPTDARKSPLIAVEVKNIHRKGVLVEIDSCVL